MVMLVLSLTIHGWAQYVKTDELVFLPGYEQPITLEEYNQLQDSLQELQSAYLSQFLLPGNGGYIISRFGPRSGRMHYGTDIKMNSGDTVYATQSGNIIRANWGYGYGNLMVIQHNNSIQTYYAHLTAFIKAQGQWVAKGEAIALAGSTGRTRGPHLHFEMRENGQPFDPEMVFDFKNNKIRDEAVDCETLLALHKRLKPMGYGNNQAVPEFYKVRSGDSLWAISRRYKTPIKEICRLNRITENTVLQIGQGLRMY
jgi:hypothetical protein